MVEVCRPGVAHDMTSVQGVLASTIWHVLAPVFDEEFPGLYEMGNSVKKLVANEMPESYSKEWLRAKGICSKVMVPLKGKNGQICGILAVNYDYSNCAVCDQCKKSHDLLLDYAGRISFAMEN